jgi:hypothetical protein
MSPRSAVVWRAVEAVEEADRAAALEGRRKPRRIPPADPIGEYRERRRAREARKKGSPAQNPTMEPNIGGEQPEPGVCTVSVSPAIFEMLRPLLQEVDQ